MNLTESYKKRIIELSGIISEDLDLNAITGRSGKDTLGFYIEEYILNLGGKILNQLDNSIKQNNNLILIFKKSESKILNNNLSLSIEIENHTNKNNIKKTNFILNLLVKLESNSNTVAILKYENLNDEFNLESKHSEQDISDFINEIEKRILNTFQVSTN